MLNALSVDVEDYYQVSAFARQVSPDAWAAYSPRVVRNTMRLLEMFDRHRVRGTFFVLGWVAERNRALVAEIGRRGHEVACHGYSHQLVYQQAREQFREETHRAKSVLEEITGNEVAGYRAASFSIIECSRWALDVLAEEGFRYDSSIYPIRHDRYGMPEAPAVLHRLTTPEGRTLIEFPPTAIEAAGLRVPVGGGGYFRLYPYWMTRAALRALNNQGRACMCYFHPWEIDPRQPRLQARLVSRFRHYVNLQRTEPRLRQLMADFEFAPVREVLAVAGLLPYAGGAGAEAAA